MSQDSLLQICDFVDRFEELAQIGLLTGDDLLEAWRREAALSPFEALREPELFAVPVGFHEDLSPRNRDRSKILSELGAWKPSLRIKLPEVLTWALRTPTSAWPDGSLHRNMDLFRELDLDHAGLLRDILGNPRFTACLELAFLQHPQLLECFEEEERWALLRRAVIGFGTAASWHWADYTAIYWSREATQELVLELVSTHPELAGAFLASPLSHIGWLAFETAEGLEEAFIAAAMLAPVEVFMAKTWMSTCLGDRIVNPDQSFMNVEGNEFWPNSPELFQEDLAPSGYEAYTRVERAALYALECSLEGEDRPFSATTNAVCARLTRFSITKVIEPKDVVALVEALLELPKSTLGLRLVDQLFRGQDSGKQALFFRLGQQIKRRLSRDHVLVYGYGQESIWRSVTGDRDTRDVSESWIYGAMRDQLERQGWLFAPLELRRNERFTEASARGYDPQAKIVDRHRTIVLNVWRGLDRNTLDHYPTHPTAEYYGRRYEVMIPPDFDPGRPVYERDRLAIYEVGTKIPLAGPLARERFEKYLSL